MDEEMYDDREIGRNKFFDYGIADLSNPCSDNNDNPVNWMTNTYRSEYISFR